MPDCELSSTCPFFNDKNQDMIELTKQYKEQYCHRDYLWCGRYLTYKALEIELKKSKLRLADPRYGVAGDNPLVYRN